MAISNELDIRIKALLEQIHSLGNDKETYQQCFSLYSSICKDFCKEMGYDLHQEFGESLHIGQKEINLGDYKEARLTMTSNLGAMV